MKKVILVYTQLNEFGGIEYLFVQLAKFLKKRKTKLTIVCFEDKINFSKYEKNIEVIKLSNRQNILKRAKNLKKTIDEINHEGLPLFYDLKSIAYAKLANIKNYNIALTDPPSLLRQYEPKARGYKRFRFITKNYIFEKIIKGGVENAKKVIVMNKSNAKEYKSIYKIKPKIIYPGIYGHFNKEGVTPKPLVYKKELNLISVCRLAKSKNLDWILFGIKYLLKKNKENKYFKNINLKIIGSGPELKTLKKVSKEMNVSKNTQFYGFISESKKNRLFSNSHINLIPAVSAYNLPALESLRLGVPVVINEKCRMNEILKNNQMVKITKNNKFSFSKDLYKYTEDLKNKKISNYKLSHLPTFNNWALDLCKSCNWF